METATLPVQELRRRHGLHANQLYRWKQALGRSLGDSGSGGSEAAGLGRRLQPNRTARRDGNEIPHHILYGLDVKNKHYTCLNLGGAVH